MVLKKSFGKIGKSVVATTIALSVLATPISYKTFAATPDHIITATIKEKEKTNKNNGKHEVNLRILGTTDIHTNLYNYDYYKDTESLEFGLAKTATLIKQARAEAKTRYYLTMVT